MTGFVGECFHVFNKHASAAEVKPYFQTEEVSSQFLQFPVIKWGVVVAVAMCRCCCCAFHSGML